MKQTYGISYTLSGMTYWLRAHGFSYKNPAATPSKADLEKQEIFIQHYEKLLKMTSEDEPILFGYGVHLTMATKITYGWIRKGMRQPIATTASRVRINVMRSLDLSRIAVLRHSMKSLIVGRCKSIFSIFESSIQRLPEST
ncbi:hypothetical protein K737_301033 [Holospora undulata HU1]|uniref:Winged helix-turn helix domain-containing protein n=1 Tax=Holospora undulata HU1 TaxID=1321371 RepID=A0A061JFS7_9PROT|nr:hypothetical protein K737_301033 [Holospora undulata HU1]